MRHFLDSWRGYRIETKFFGLKPNNFFHFCWLYFVERLYDEEFRD